MKQFITLCLLALATATTVTASADGPARSASLDNLRIKGIMMYDNDKSVETTGLYSYTVKAPIERRQHTCIPRISVNGGSVVANNKLYSYVYDIQYGFVNSARYYVYDLTTGEELSSTSIGYDVATAYNHASTTSAIDPTTGIVYCSGYNYSEADKKLYPTLKTWQLEANTKTEVGSMTAPLIAMAFDKDGQLWGITASSSKTSEDGGFLVSINKTTGEQTLIGDTGVRPYFDQSAVFDFERGTFYWLANTQNEEANLYSVDLNSGAATLIGEFPNGDEVVAAFITPNEYDDAAPSPVDNLTCSIAPDYKLNFTFDMPDKSYDGNALTGTLAWQVTAKGTETITKSGTAEAGAQVTDVIEMTSSGMVELSISASKEQLTGPDVAKSIYVGYDKMHAVSNLTLKHDSGINTLSWEAPTTGHFNGLMSDKGLSYKIVRMPEQVVVNEAFNGTTFTETVTDDNLRSTYYNVMAVNGDVVGDEASSNTVITGSAITPPYSQDFDLANALDLYTIKDGNNDNNTWYYSVKSAKYRQSTSKEANDYLFMPAFNLKAGYSYELTFDGYGTNTRYTNLIDVVIATTPDADAATAITETPIKFVNDSRSVINETVIIKPETDGKYYIGFHIVSEKSQGTFTIDNVKLAAGKSTAVPAAATTFTATAGERGALTAQLNITAPTLTAGNNPLGANELGFKVMRGDEQINVGTIAPGASTEIQDNTITNAGKYTYTVTFNNNEGEGEPATTEVYVGTDSPVAPAAVTISDNNDGTALVVWEASANGVNGGYVDTENVIYTIVDRTNNVLKTDIKGTSATIDIPSDGAQAIFTVKVAAAYTPNAKTPATESNEILSGKPYALPYAESFAGAEATTTPWIKETVSGLKGDTSWAARPDHTQDNDGGAADMTAYDAASSRWAGPKIDISTAADPWVSAYVYLPGGNTIFTLQVQKDNGEWVSLKSIDNAADDWVNITTSLIDHKSKNIRLGLLGECLSGMQFIYVDNITITDKASGIDSITANDEAEISVSNGAIVVTAAKELPIAVYTIDGRCIANSYDNHATIHVNAGAYLVKAGSRTVKVIL